MQKFSSQGWPQAGSTWPFLPMSVLQCMHLISSQIQMEKLASRHAISELFNWISLMENVIEEDEENLKSAVGSNVIQDYLQKYKVVVNLSYRLLYVYITLDLKSICEYNTDLWNEKLWIRTFHC